MIPGLLEGIPEETFQVKKKYLIDPKTISKIKPKKMKVEYTGKQEYSIYADELEYNREISVIEKELRKDLFNCKINYLCKKKDIKNWFNNKFLFREDLQEISSEDLYFIAEELCNIKFLN